MELVPEAIPTTKFIGRQNEMETINSYFDKAKNGEGQLIFVVGETGIGKTRLVQEVGLRNQGEGVQFRSGRCISQQHADPYLPFIDALSDKIKGEPRQSPRKGSDELPMGMVGFNGSKSGGYVGPSSDLPLGLIPMAEEGSEIKEVDMQTQRDMMFKTISQLIIDIANENPLLLFIDDLQWADAATLQLLFYITRNIKSTKVLLVCAYRPEELDTTYGEQHPLKQMLGRMNQEKMYTMMPLSRMSPTEISEIIQSLLDVEEVPKGFLSKLYDESEGNPFFIEEVLKSLMDEGIIKRHAHIWDAGVDLSSVRIPTSIKDVIGHRIARLDERTRRVLRYASVIGNQFQFEVLQMVTEMNSEELLDTIDHLTEREIIHEDISAPDEEVFTFGHKQTRLVIYESMSKSRIRILHQKVGEVIEKLYHGSTDDVVFSLAHHYDIGKNFVKSHQYSKQAGKKAVRSFAFEDAIEYYNTALRTLNFLDGESGIDIQKESLSLLMKIGNLYYHMGDPASAIAQYDDALKYSKALEDNATTAEAYLWLGHSHKWRGNYHKAEEVYEKAIILFKEYQNFAGIAECQRGLGYVHWRKGENNEAVEHYKESISHSMKAGDNHGLAKTHIELGNLNNSWGEHEIAMEYYLKSIPHLEEIRDYNELARAYNNMGDTYLRTKQWGKALEYLEKCIEASETIGNNLFVGWGVFNSAEALANLGELDKAEEYCDRALKIVEDLDDKIGMNGVFKNYGIIYTFKEEWDKAIENFNKSIVILEMLDIPNELGLTYWHLGKAYMAMGEKSEALENFKISKDLLVSVGAKKEVQEVEKKILELEG